MVEYVKNLIIWFAENKQIEARLYLFKRQAPYQFGDMIPFSYKLQVFVIFVLRMIPCTL